VEIYNAHLLESNETFNMELCNYQNTYEENAKILQILENTVNIYKFNTCTMRYFLCLEVCYLVLFFWIVFSCSYSISVCIPILINVPTPFIF
jgi:hypothetical protein